jgi:hypothetical protein
MAEDKENLRAAVARYAALDDELQELNRQVYQRREARSIIEMEIGDILRSPAYSTFNKLSVGNSEIAVKRPQQWSNPWSLSKGALMRYGTQYKQQNPNPTVDGFITFLENTYGPTRVADRFSLTRTTHTD